MSNIIKQSPNINQLWANLIVEEFIRQGVDYFCIAPGSRSTPLAVAVANHSQAKYTVHFDERGLGFHALGYVSSSKKPCVVITTSGTAVANLFPAIIETSKKKLPLIILTGDRPPELRNTGANQTIDQIKIFGEYVRWFFDLPTPSLNIKPEFVLTTVGQSIAHARGGMAGPVHLNCMFREPLAPIHTKNNFKEYLISIETWLKNTKPYTTRIKSESYLRQENLEEVIEILNTSKTGLIAVGKISGFAEAQAILQIADKLKWPIFADISSGLRLGSDNKNIIHYFDQVLVSEKMRKKIKPQCILHCGGRITSKRYYDLIEQTRPEHYIMILPHPLRNDPTHQVTVRIQGAVGSIIQDITPFVSKHKADPIVDKIQKANITVSVTLNKFAQSSNQLTEPLVARLISELIPAQNGLFLGNSLAIREMDMFAANTGKAVIVGGNRGASGIDGTIATACGFSVGLNQPVTVLLGDLSFLYDLNSLALLKNAPHPITIVVLNNDGGGIFSFLPIGKFDNFLQPLFTTPHGLTFEKAAELFDLDYCQPKNKKDFMNVYQRCVNKNTTIIEISSDVESNLKTHQLLQQKVREGLEN